MSGTQECDSFFGSLEGSGAGTFAADAIGEAFDEIDHQAPDLEIDILTLHT